MISFNEIMDLCSTGKQQEKLCIRRHFGEAWHRVLKKFRRVVLDFPKLLGNNV